MGIVATDAAAVPVFPEGSTVVGRDTLRGKVFSAIPYRVIRDTGAELVLALWPGVEMLSPSTRPARPARIRLTCEHGVVRGQGSD